MSVVARTLAGSMVAVALLSAAAPAWADQPRDQQWWLSTLDISAAHAVTRGAGVTVAVIDSGVDATHPDLAGAIVPGADPSAVVDLDGRGTALAALIAGRGHGAGRADGVLGIAPEAMVLPIAFAPRAGEAGTTDLLATGIDRAVAQGASVICIGRGVPASTRLGAAVDAALAHDVVVVAADGNRPGDAFQPWPASFPGVLTAVALDRLNRSVVPPASRLHTGIGVPGGDLVSAGPGGGYRTDTSAVGVLCGAVALMRSRSPRLPVAEVAALLRQTATDLGAPGPDAIFGTGSLDLAKVLAAVPVPSAPSPSPEATSAATASPAAATPAPPSVAASPSARAWTPLTGSDDWRRWLVVLPPLIFLAGLAGYAVRR